MELDPDRTLALAYVPAAARPAIEALWRLDLALASILATGTQPMISRLRLAWWRESLERLDRAPPPAQPVLQALATHVLPEVSGAELAAMEEGWLMLTAEDALTTETLSDYGRLRGGLLFTYAARLLGDSGFPVADAGEAWALADLARHSRRVEEISAPQPALKVKWPRALRPLGMLAMLARRDLERLGEKVEKQGNPARILRMAAHRFSGY